MNLFIYVLFLSIWTNSCLNTNQSDGSSTTGAKHVQSMETEMDNFRRRLLVIIIGIMIIAFVFTCFCFLHYNCMSDEAPKAGTLKKEDVTAKSSRSSKISFSEHKIASPCSLEKQSMLASRDKFSGPSNPENSSRPSSAEKLIRPSSPGKQCISSSKEKLNSLSSQEKLHKPSSPQKIFRSTHPGKSYRTHNLEKPHKLAHACKLGGQACSSYPNKARNLNVLQQHGASQQGGANRLSVLPVPTPRRELGSSPPRSGEPGCLACSGRAGGLHRGSSARVRDESAGQSGCRGPRKGYERSSAADELGPGQGSRVGLRRGSPSRQAAAGTAGRRYSRGSGGAAAPGTGGPGAGCEWGGSGAGGGAGARAPGRGRLGGGGSAESLGGQAVAGPPASPPASRRRPTPQCVLWTAPSQTAQ
ncbi:PREDICTED: uncharacterized protein LOC101386600 [Odobenus rosmarus divergens]|uniref:Uncharacterized protein LOC101386600 n=1 Tax=Odobenus rosmarus divergens TaxID=9708 RepID=A0A9B0GVA7_ODORO